MPTFLLNYIKFYTTMVVCMVVLAAASSQSSPFDNYETINLTIDDGLPSNELYDLVEDSRGYIWIASDRGLVRYDGYGFKTYGFADGLGDISCLRIEIDKHDNIWIMTYSRRFYIYNSQTDRIVAYKHQSIVDKQLARGQVATEFFVDNEDNLLICIAAVGIVRFSDNGTSEIINHCNNPRNIYYSIKVGSRRLSSTISRIKKEVPKIEYNCELYNFSNCRATRRSGGETSGFHYINQDTAILTIGGCQYFFEDNQLVDIHFAENIQSIIPYGKGFICLQLNKLGATWHSNYSTLKSNNGVNFLPNTSTTTAILSKSDLLVISSVDKGLFIFTKPQASRIVDINSSVTSTEQMSDSSISYVCNQQDLKTIFVQNDKVQQQYSCRKIFDLTALDDSIIVAAAPYPIAIEGTESRPIKMRNDDVFSSITTKRICLFTNEQWLISYATLYRYKGLKKMPEYNSADYFNSLKIETIAPYQDSIYLIGCPDGMYTFNLTSRSSLKHLYPAFSRRINDIILYQDKYYIATLGGGIAIWDGDQQYEVITTAEGLVSDNIERLELRENKLLASTFSGLSVIEIENESNYAIRNYTTSNGLPSNQVFDAELLRDTLYIGTGRGLVMLRDQIKVVEPKMPIIEQVNDIHSRAALSTRNLTFPHEQSNIDITYKTIDINRQGEIIYRYRLNKGAWTTATSTSLNYTDLSPNRYQFDVEASYGNDQWSDTKSILLTIRPPWWETLLFRILVLLLIAATIVWLFRRSLRRIDEKNSIQEEIRALEKAALQAQMNPHFIFNCLNSIQAFIMDNEKEQAMDYLAQFAQLIRGTLVASTESTISLTDEIAILQNYLSLEQLRMDQAFKYNIYCHSAIDQSETLIPPMLIGPFIENAVIHGMHSRKGDGLINVRFDYDDHKLLVKISDNGKKSPNQQRKRKHKSLGTAITKKRLSHINQISEDKVQLSIDYEEAGTIVSLAIIVDVKTRSQVSQF